MDYDRLIEVARIGDGEAWTAIFEACYLRLVALAERMHPIACDPQDIASEAMKRLVEEFERTRFRSIDELMAWLEGEVARVIMEDRVKSWRG